jgi:hypothetical protein
MPMNDKSAAAPLELRAGPLRMIFEPHSAFLRYVKLGEREVVRGVYGAVRDRNWGTIAPTISNLQTRIAESSFELQFEARHRRNEIDFVWRGELSGSTDGTIIYHFRGVAESDFWRNRIGLCVLHPMDECGGQPCGVLHTDGTYENSAFPDDIAPHQPFLNVRALSHEVAPGVRFEGDTFETEDQRNWTDASFKTYSTPLALPYPAEIQHGTRIEQSVVLSLRGQIAQRHVRHRSARPEEITVSISQETPVLLPPIGLGMASHGLPLSETAISQLRVLAPAHLRVDVRLDEDYQAVWRRARAEAGQLQAPLEVALFVSDAAADELQRFVELAGDAPPIARWMIFHRDEKVTSCQWIEVARKYLQRVSSAPIGSGTNAYFTELNRGRVPLDAVDFVVYSLNPQVHAFDDRSLIETPPAQAQTVRSARHFAPGKPVVVSPITLRPRTNADATGEVKASATDELPPNVDARQLSLLGAAWTLASVKYLAQAGAASLTYYETTGWRGVLETEAGSPLPQLFPSRAGAVFPLYHVLADIAAFAGGGVLPSRSSAPLQVESLALQHGEKRAVLLANFSAAAQRVRIENFAGGARVGVLCSSIELPPHGFVRVEQEKK